MKRPLSAIGVLGVRGPVIAALALALLFLPPKAADAQVTCPTGDSASELVWVCVAQLPPSFPTWPPDFCGCATSLFERSCEGGSTCSQCPADPTFLCGYHCYPNELAACVTGLELTGTPPPQQPPPGV